MATEQQLIQKFMNAEKAGDSKSAAIFANEIKKVRKQAASVDDSIQKSGSYEDVPWTDVATSAAYQMGPSIKQELTNVWDAVTSPIDTAENLYDLAQGTVRLAVPGGEHPSEDMARAVGDYYSEKYGTIDGFKKAVAEEPASILSDVASVLSGGGAAVAKLPGMAGKFGKLATASSKVIDPLSLAAQATGKVLNPATKKAVKLLQKEGVTMTPGQLMSGVTKGVEDRLSGVPLVGDFINNSVSKSFEEFNRAAYNRALNPIGKKATAKTPIGPDGVDFVQTELSKAYDKILPNLKLKVTDKFKDDILKATVSAADEMGSDKANQLLRIVENRVLSRIDDATELSGKQIKNLESELTDIGGKLQKEGNVFGADAIRDTLEIIREELVVSNPTKAKALKRVNLGYANFKRIQKAAAASTDQSSGFTPSQLHSAVKSLDKSKDGGDFARGKSLMYDLSAAGKEVLPNKIPDSGTAGRAITVGMLGGGMTIEPIIATLVAAGLTPYMARKQAQAILSKRPQILRDAGKMVSDIVTPKITQPLQQSGRLGDIYEENEQ